VQVNAGVASGRVAVGLRLAGVDVTWFVTGTLTPPDPGAHDLGSQPVPALLGLDDNGYAVARAQPVRAPGQQERGHVSMQRPAGLQMAIMLAVDRMTEQGPPLTVVVLNVMPGVEKWPWPRGRSRRFTNDHCSQKLHTRGVHGGAEIVFLWG
jgi:hypothetical protein